MGDRRYRSHDLTPADRQALAALAEYASMISHRISVPEAIDIGVGPTMLERLEERGWCRRDPSSSGSDYEISRQIGGAVTGSISPTSERIASLERQFVVANSAGGNAVLWCVAVAGVAAVVWIGLSN